MVTNSITARVFILRCRSREYTDKKRFACDDNIKTPLSNVFQTFFSNWQTYPSILNLHNAS